MRRYIFILFYLATCLAMLISASGKAQTTGSSWTVKWGLPKAFIENQGQFNIPGSTEHVVYACDQSPTMIYFTEKGVYYCFRKALPKKVEKVEGEEFATYEEWKEKEEEERRTPYETDMVSFQWMNPNPELKIIAEEQTRDYFSYSMRNADRSVKNINNIKGYKKIIYKNVYPFVDVEYVFHPVDGLKYSLILHPGAGIAKIGMLYSKRPEITAEGDIRIPTKFGDIVDHAPVAFYKDSPSRKVTSHFAVDDRSVSFVLDAYRLTETVVIDPWTQTPSLSNSNCVWECERDAGGNVYIIGGDVPLRLQKYNAAGALQWTYTTPWDTVAGDWLGTMATDLAGNSYVTNGSIAELEKINNGGGMVYHTAGGAMDEYWNIAFNCDQTRLIIGGTRLVGIPSITGSGIIYDINASNGSVSSFQKVGDVMTYTVFGMPVTDPNEVRSITSSYNARYYYMTLDSLGAIDQDFGACPNGYSLLKLPHGYSFGYKCENFRPNNGNAGIMAMRANRNFLYTQNGATLHKRSLATGAVLNSATLPGGISNTVGMTTPVLYQAGNSGVDIDSCGNVYAGSGNAILKYDANLNFITSAATTYKVYDVTVSSGGNVIICGATGDNSSPSRTGYIQSVNMSACHPIALYCCDANICPVESPCSDDPPFNLTAGSPGGTWSGTGITNATTGTFDPSVAGPGTFWIHYTLPCGTDSVQITVLNCTNLSLCVELNGDIYVSGGNGPYNWEKYHGPTTSPITNQAECVACGYTWNSLMSLCLNGMIPVTVCNVPAGWTNFATGTTITPPGVWPIRVTDFNGNQTVLDSIAYLALPPCNACQSSTAISNMDSACAGMNNGSFDATTTGINPPFDYSLNHAGGAPVITYTNMTGTQHFTGLAPGNYDLFITDSLDCIDTISITINQITLNLTLIPQNEGCQHACDGQIAANVSGGSAPYAYSWSNGQSAATDTSLCEGNYNVHVTDANGCTASNTAHVGYNVAISASFTADPQSGSVPLSVHFTFTGTGANYYLWSFGDGDSAFISGPSHIFDSTGSYYVLLIVGSGFPDFCIDSFRLLIEVGKPSRLTVPNMFSPNGDGHNDVFKMDYREISTFNCVIFNRWGRKISEWSNIVEGWDGNTSSGQPAADGVYFYIVTARGNDNVEYNFHGIVTLLR